MSAQAHQLLVRAKEIITDPAKWTTNTYARDAEGRHVGPEEPCAACFCTYGAAYRAAAELRSPRAAVDEAFRSLQTEALYRFPKRASVSLVNDTLGHEAALQLLGYAIESTRS